MDPVALEPAELLLDDDVDDEEPVDEEEPPADGAEEVEPCEDDVEEPFEEGGGGVVPASGSVYCWPEAEPAARAAPAPTRATLVTTNRHASTETKRRIPGY